MDELRIFVSEKKPHILGIIETKIDDSNENSDIEIDDNVVERNDRNKYGRVVVLSVHKSISYKLRDDLFIDDVESLSLQVKTGNYKPFIITSVCRPPGKPVELFKYIDNLFDTIDSEDKEAVYKVT